MSDLTLKDVYIDLKKEFDSFKEGLIRVETKIDVIATRTDLHEKEIEEIKKKLEGVITAKALKSWVLGTASILAAILFLLQHLMKILA